MIYTIVYIIALVIFVGSPLPLQIIFMLLNLVIPDPIPILVEAWMMASIIKICLTVIKIKEFAEEYPKIFIAILIGIVVVIIVLLRYM